MRGLFATCLLTIGVAACAANSQPRDPRPSDHPTAGTAAGSPDAGRGTPPTPADPGLIPARVRRLSNAEYNASASNLLQGEVRAADAFAPDSRQGGFTVNEAQRVDPVLAKQLFAAAEKLAADARSRLASQWPCTTPAEPEACAAEFIERFGARAYRRPLTTDESDGLLAVYRVGAADGDGDSHEAGLELVVRAVLQSAGFLYLTELGPPGAPASAPVELEPAELASSLSYLVTGGPPDDALRQAAEQGELASPEGREAQLRRLHGDPRSLDRLTQLVREWLELDRIESTAKDSTVYPQYDGLKDAIVRESHNFVRAVLDPAEQAQSDVEALLGADWTVNEGGLQNLYTGASDMGNGRLSLPERRGVLNQAAFLSVKAHAHESTPVLRGVMVARRLSCLQIASPSSLNIDVVPPVPDPSQTTRQRFAVHTSDAQCAQCHRVIDGLGNAFEQYDGMGMFRSMENGLAVDSTTTVDVGNELDGDYPDSNALALGLAQSDVVRECFARHVFRAAAARSGPGAAGQEQAFIAEWKALPRAEQGNLIDTLAVFVRSALFTQRGAGQ